MTKFKNLWNKFWRDKTGHIVILQIPNLPLSIWIVCTILTKIFTQGSFHNGVSFFGTAAIIVWAYLEVQSGASYFRRTLGAIVLAFTILSRFR